MVLNVSSTEDEDLTSNGLIDQVTYYYLTLTLRVILNPGLAFIALCAAFLNVAVFSRTDLSQGVNLNLLVLSTSDLLISIIAVLGNFSLVAMWFDATGDVIAREILFMSVRVVIYPVTVSTVVTTVIAVVRCLSVVKPLHFNSVITAKRQALAIVLACCAGFSIPLHNQIMVHGIQRRDGEQNWDRRVFDIFRNLFFVTCFIVVTASMTFLTVALKKSSRFRHASSSAPDSQSKLSSTRKEVKVVKMVIFVLVVFAVCNLPFILLSILRLASSEFYPEGQYARTRGLVDMLVSLGISLNVSLNSLVYLRFNSRYRSILLSALSRFSTTEKSLKSSGLLR